VVEKAKAVSPDLVAALSAFGEREMVAKVAQSMAPLGIIGGKSVVDVLKQLLEGTNLGRQLQATAAQEDPFGDVAVVGKGRNRKGD
jgi:major vault protein